jgi:DNA-binding transcriptional regulator LsrR (DeoR family)
MVRSGCLSTKEIARLARQGAVGDVLGNYMDIEGRLIAAPHSDRVVALSVDELRRIETVVAVASEAEKPRAILGTLRAGVIDVLIVDETNARAVLDMARRGGDESAATGRVGLPAGSRVVGKRVAGGAVGNEEVIGRDALS